MDSARNKLFVHGAACCFVSTSACIGYIIPSTLVAVGSWEQ